MNLLHQLLGIGEAAVGMHPASNNSAQGLQAAGVGQALQGVGQGAVQNAAPVNQGLQGHAFNGIAPGMQGHAFTPGLQGHAFNGIAPGLLQRLAQLHGTLGNPIMDTQLQNPTLNLQQGGQYNPGFTPYQGAGFSPTGVGFTQGFQPAYQQGNDQQFGGGNINIGR